MIIIGNDAQHGVEHSAPRVGSKKLVQQGLSQFSVRSVHAVREHGKSGENAAGGFFQRTHNKRGDRLIPSFCCSSCSWHKIKSSELLILSYLILSFDLSEWLNPCLLP